MTSDFRQNFSKAFGFDPPAAYESAWKNQRLSYRSTLGKAERFESYRADPPLLVCSPRLEWFTQESELLGHKLPPYLVKSPKLVQFASGAAGEHWCFVPEWSKDGSVPIAFIEVDYDHAYLFAPSFEGLVFRELVESLASWSFWVNDFCKLGVAPADLIAFAKRIVETSRPYLLPHYVCELEAIVSKPLDDKGNFVSSSEVRTLVARVLAYPRLNEKFISRL